MSGGLEIPLEEVAKPIVNRLKSYLDMVNMFVGEQAPQGGRLSVNSSLYSFLDEELSRCSHRHGLLNGPSPDWDNLWDRIKQRIEHDEAFRVQGFTREEVKTAVSNLEVVFPNEWVRAQYRVYHGDKSVQMHDEFPPESGLDTWFPAQHLARTACGIICVDPGWCYLVNIGLAIERTRDVPNIDKLIRKLTKSPGNQHHLCLASELKDQGILVGVEELIGGGPASNDIRVKVRGLIVDIEVKEFGTSKPMPKIQSELDDKDRKLPKQPKNPVVFHVVLREKADPTEPKKEKDFIKAFQQAVLERFSNKISAVVIGTRFIDPRGGVVKREVAAILLNDKAIRPITEDVLHEIFPQNFEDTLYPVSAIGTLFYLGSSSEASKKKREAYLRQKLGED